MGLIGRRRTTERQNDKSHSTKHYDDDILNTFKYPDSLFDLNLSNEISFNYLSLASAPNNRYSSNNLPQVLMGLVVRLGLHLPGNR